MALVNEDKGRLDVFCSGTVIGKRLVITAAHCVEEWYQGKLFIGAGTNPRKGKLIPVSRLKFILNSGLDEETRNGDLAILFFDEPLRDFEPVSLGIPSELSSVTILLQSGYGYNTKEERKHWPFLGKLLMESNAKFESLEDKILKTVQSSNSGVLGGDSGGPLYSLDRNKLRLQGVLASGEYGGDSVIAKYTHPHFALTWMNCALPEDDRITLPPIGVFNQIPCDSQPLIKMEDVPSFTKKLCEIRNPGWTISQDTGCWPETKEACLELARETSGDVFWDELTRECDITE